MIYFFSTFFRTAKKNLWIIAFGIIEPLVGDKCQAYQPLVCVCLGSCSCSVWRRGPHRAVGPGASEDSSAASHSPEAALRAVVSCSLREDANLLRSALSHPWSAWRRSCENLCAIYTLVYRPFNNSRLRCIVLYTCTFTYILC